MKVLIIGYGSIAKKHISALKLIYENVVFYALRSSIKASEVDGVFNIYNWEDIPNDIGFVIISNPTSKHYSTIEKSISLKVPLFIEKAPLDKMEGAEALLEKIRTNKIITYTSFNLRFHPVIVWLKDYLKDKNVIEVQSYCGSYLPEWRPGIDYREVYSAKKEQGGGVHLDLMHEMDYIVYLFGKPKKTNSFLSRKSKLEINSMDSAHYWLEYETMNVSILLNYYRKVAKRNVEIVMEDGTIIANLLTSTICNENGEVLFKGDSDMMISYVEQMKYFTSCLLSKNKPMNDLKESLATLKFILSSQSTKR